MTPIQRSPRNPASLSLSLLLALSTASPSHGQEPQAGEKPPAYLDHARLLVVRDGSGKERPVETPADWAVRRGHILGHLQEVMGPFPGAERRADLDWKILSTHKEDGYVRHKIDFQSEPGDRVPAWLLIPDAPEGATAPVKRPAMLCLHQTIAIGKDEPAGLGKNPNLKYARELAERVGQPQPVPGEHRPEPGDRVLLLFNVLETPELREPPDLSAVARQANEARIVGQHEQPVARDPRR